MNSTKKIPLVAVVGPTASGKTGLGIKIAKRYSGEIVSADSMQIYKYMNIATAKPSSDEMQGIPHHLIDFLSPSSSFSVADYVSLAHNTIADIFSRGKLPVLVGGTGLYVSSLLDNIDFSPSGSDEKLRAELSAICESEGLQKLLDILSEFDPESASRLSTQKNKSRIIRAIEIYKTTGQTMTETLKKSKLNESPYSDLRIGLNVDDRSFLYDRINTRVDIMLDMSLLEETKRIMNMNLGQTARMAIGYKELIPYINGEISYDEAVNKLKMETRRYAKRQLTWFRRDNKIHWINIDRYSEDEIFAQSCKYIEAVLNMAGE